MAYICKRKNRESKYYVYLSEGYRVGNKTKTRNLIKYGQLNLLEEKEPGIYERLRAEAKAGVLIPKENKSISHIYDLDEKINDSQKLFGWKFLNTVYDQFKISKILTNHSKIKKYKYDLDQVCKLLVFQRYLNPDSKLKTNESQDKFMEIGIVRLL